MTRGTHSLSPEQILYGHTESRRSQRSLRTAPEGLDCFSTGAASGYFEYDNGWSGTQYWLANVAELPIEMLPETNNWQNISKTLEDEIREKIADITHRNTLENPRLRWHNAIDLDIDRGFSPEKGKVSIARQGGLPSWFTQLSYLQAVEQVVGDHGEWKRLWSNPRKLYYLVNEEDQLKARGLIWRITVTT